MASIEEFDSSLVKTKWALLFSGITIYPIGNKKWESFLKFVFYFYIPWLYTDVLGEFCWLFYGAYEGKSFSELSFVAPCATICMLATAKSTPLFIHQKLLIEMVTRLRELHPKEDELVKKKYTSHSFDKNDHLYFESLKREDERKMVEDSMLFLNRLIALLFYPSVTVVVVFTTLPLVSMGYKYYTAGETELILPFLVMFFFDPFSKTMWPFMYFHQVWSTLIAAGNVFGADTLLYALCTFMKIHFQLLCNRFEDVVGATDQETRRRLVELVKRHQELILMVDQMEQIHSKSLLFNITTSSILICLSGFNIMFLEDRIGVVAFLTFLSMSLTQISLLCMFGDLLINSSLKLTDAIYKCRWYDTVGRTRKDILFCLIRSHRPCKLTAAKFADVRLTSLTTILSRSWSLFALLRTMYD